MKLHSLQPLSEEFVTPPPWRLGENEKLDETYVKFMQELQKTDWEIEITKKKVFGE